MVLLLAIISRVFQLILFKFILSVFILITRQGFLLGFFMQSWTNFYSTLGLRTRIINWLTVREKLGP